jgi:hypothetical protein
MSRCRTVHARCTCGYSPVAGARQSLVGPSLLTSPACMPETTRASVSSQPVLTHASNPVASETRLAGACAVAGSVDAVGVGTATSVVGVALVDVCSGRWEPFHSAAGHVQRRVPACRHSAPAPILRTQPCGPLPRWYSTAGPLCTPSHLRSCCQCQRSPACRCTRGCCQRWCRWHQDCMVGCCWGHMGLRLSSSKPGWKPLHSRMMSVCAGFPPLQTTPPDRPLVPARPTTITPLALSKQAGEGRMCSPVGGSGLQVIPEP